MSVGRSVADQNFDSAVALCAPLDGLIARGPLRREGARLDSVRRHAGLRLADDLV